MANYVKLSELEEGTICNVELADGSLEKYVLAKHDYESDLNGAGRVLFVSYGSDQFTAHQLCESASSSYNQTGFAQNGITSNSCLNDYLNGSSFKKRFSSIFLQHLTKTTIYYNYASNSGANSICPDTISTLFFVPSAIELGITEAKCIKNDYSTALSTNVINKVLQGATTDIWTRILYDGTVRVIDDEDEDGNVTYVLVNNYAVYINTSKVAKSYEVSNKLKYTVCFTLPQEVYVDTEDNNKFIFSIPIPSLSSYISVNGTARTLNYLFVGVDNIAKKVTRAYIGVNNIARVWYKWIASGISINNMLKPNTSNFRTKLAGAAVSGSALFVGGECFTTTTSGSYSSISKTTLAEVFNEDQTTSLAPNLPAAVDFFAGASVGDSAIFGGGWNASDERSSTVCMYQPNFTQTSLSSLSATIAENSGASTKSYALLVGGTNKTSWGSRKYVSTVYPYSADGTAQSTTTLSSSCGKPGTATFNGGAIIAGGYTASSAVSTVNYINDSLTRTTLTELSQARGFVAGGASDDLIVFVGGNNKQGGGTFYPTIDAYDSNLTKIDIGANVLNDNSSYSQMYVGGYVPIETKKCPNGVFVFSSVTSHIYIDAKNGTLLEGTDSLIDEGISAYGYSQYRIYSSVCTGRSLFKYGSTTIFVSQYTASTD